MIPHGVTRLDSDDATLHIVHVVLVLFKCHSNNSHIDFAVDTLRMQAVFQHHIGLVCHLYSASR